MINKCHESQDSPFIESDKEEEKNGDYEQQVANKEVDVDDKGFM
jgi:hypothetical protein